MNKRGFTLIELIAVITFIALIILVSTPLILNQISTSRETKYKTFESDLCLAAESYITHTLNGGGTSFDTPGESMTLTLNTLISNGYVKSSTINPRTKQRIAGTSTLTVTLTNDYTYECTFNE